MPIINSFTAAIIGLIKTMNEYIVSINKKKNKVEFVDGTRLIFNGEELNFELFESVNNKYLLRIDKKIFNFTCVSNSNDEITLYSNNKKFDVIVRSVLQEKAAELLSRKSAEHQHTDVKAPMPGMILKIKKQIGDLVDPGEAVIVLEAMKMENEIRTVTRGRIKNIFIKEGTAVEKGTILFSVEN